MTAVRLPLSVYSFRDEILVECPKCGGCATVTGTAYDRWAPTLVCPACGYVPKKVVRYPSGSQGNILGLDPAYGLPLWLRETVGRHVIWAYNWRHLEDLEFFVTGSWRLDRHRWTKARGPRTTFQTRLPQWMHETKNRAGLTQAIRRIKRRRMKG